MSTGLANKLNELGLKVAERSNERQTLESELEDTDQVSPQKKSTNGLTSNKLVELAEESLYQNEQLGLFDAIPIASKNALPTLLTRIPLFMPIPKAKQKEFLDDDNALPFETPFGEGKRYGANLCVFDEDVMYCLSRLSKKRLSGERDKLPISVPITYKSDEKGKVHVNAVLCTVSEILKELELSDGGRERKRIIESIERLSSATLVLKLNKHDRYLGHCEIGKAIKLLDVEWQRYSTDGIIYGQFSPVFTYWLEEEYTFVDWEIRKKLKTSLAKALHRYLSGQLSNRNKELTKLNKLDDIALSIGYSCRKSSMKKNFQKALEELKSAGYLLDADITGTGRAESFRILAIKA
jgi:hypothetical protein